MESSTTYNISELIITINLIGDINYKINKFDPKMIYRSSISNKVLFIPNVPINMEDLIKSNVIVKKERYNPSDFINVFSNPSLLNRLIQYIKRNKGIKQVSTEEAERKGYIKSNIKLILSIYFDSENKISINNRNYPIHSYNWNDEYTSIKTNKNVPDYSINLELYVVGSENYINTSDRGRITCDIKRRNIQLDLKRLGFNIDVSKVGASEMPSNAPSVRGPYTKIPYQRSYTRQYQSTRPYRRSYITRRGGKYKLKKTIKKIKKNRIVK